MTRLGSGSGMSSATASYRKCAPCCSTMSTMPPSGSYSVPKKRNPIIVIIITGNDFPPSESTTRNTKQPKQTPFHHTRVRRPPFRPALGRAAKKETPSSSSSSQKRGSRRAKAPRLTRNNPHKPRFATPALGAPRFDPRWGAPPKTRNPIIVIIIAETRFPTSESATLNTKQPTQTPFRHTRVRRPPRSYRRESREGGWGVPVIMMKEMIRFISKYNHYFL